MLDLVKQYEKRLRESIVGKEYRLALESINATMPLRYQIRYLALDYSKISKAKHKPTVSGSKHPKLANADNATKDTVGKEWAQLEKTLGESLNRDGNSHRKEKKVEFAALPAERNPSSGNGVTPGSGEDEFRDEPRKIDLFAELDDIAAYALSETGFFCR